MPNWDKRYLTGEYNQSRKPSTLLVDHLPSLSKGKALDLACGAGKNSIFLAQNGFDVDAVDASPVAIEKSKEEAREAGVKVDFTTAELEGYRISPESYDVIIDFYYLQRSLIPAIKKGLKIGGTVLFETYTIQQRDIGHPKNPEYLLGPNELLRLFEDFHVTFYREGIYLEDGMSRAICSLAGKKL